MKKILIDFDREDNCDSLESLYKDYIEAVKKQKMTVMGANNMIFAKGMKDFIAEAKKKK